MFRRNRKARNSFRPNVDGLEAKQLLSGVPGTVLIGPGRPADVVPISVQSSGQYAIDFHGQQTSLSTKETIHLSIPGVLEQDITPPTTLSDVQSQSVSLQAGTAYNLTISPVGPSGAYALIQNVQLVSVAPAPTPVLAEFVSMSYIQTGDGVVASENSIVQNHWTTTINSTKTSLGDGYSADSQTGATITTTDIVAFKVPEDGNYSMTYEGWNGVQPTITYRSLESGQPPVSGVDLITGPDEVVINGSPIGGLVNLKAGVTYTIQIDGYDPSTLQTSQGITYENGTLNNIQIAKI